MSETETKPKASKPKAAPEPDEIAPDAPRVSAALDEYPLSEAVVERVIVRGDGARELRVLIPAE